MEGKIRDFKFNYIQWDIRSIDFLYVFLEFVLPSQFCLLFKLLRLQQNKLLSFDLKSFGFYETRTFI
ncbi:hypothetical protein B0192_22125 [Leptospira interrogans serovar Australis]|nr:hypothetical protein B0192_22125 [Leptospira interrogans serovar Australis]